MKAYTLSIDGCDDSTWLELELTEEQAAFLSDLCGRFEKASAYRCQPTMTLQEKAPRP